MYVSYLLVMTMLVCVSGGAGVYLPRRRAALGAAVGILCAALIGLILVLRGLKPAWGAGVLPYVANGLGLSFVLAAVLPYLFMLLSGRMTRAFSRWMTPAAMLLLVGLSAYGPVVSAWAARDELAGRETLYNREGICLQSRPYTCGPAAAVTVLSRLGIEAREDRIAVGALSSAFTGTYPGNLYRFLRQEYAGQGVVCEYRYPKSVDELAEEGPALVSLRQGFMKSHCVAVLDVQADEVVIADPEIGRLCIPRGQFEAQWNREAIVLSRAL